MKNLHDLRITSLTNTESGQFIKRNLGDLANAGIDLETDLQIKNYNVQMQTDSDLFDKALLQIRKNDETDLLTELDNERDTSIRILNRQFRVFELSKVPAEITAYRCLKIVFDQYKKIAAMNYEAETNAINNLLQHLTEPEYAPHVLTLSLSTYVSRLQADNNQFDIHFTNRSTETASTVVYNAREIRKTMLKNYSNYANYVLLLADSTNTNYYNTILDLINNNRKYYSDLIARRLPNKKAPAAGPATT